MAFRPPSKEPSTEYLYRCVRCGRAEWYVAELPERMLIHYVSHGGCGGRLELVATRVEKR